MSTILPFPSSPHWAPITTRTGIYASDRLDVSKSRLRANTNELLPSLVLLNGKEYQIYSLHIHSKNRKLFKQSFNKYSKKHIKSFENSSKSKLIVKIFLLSVVKSIVRRVKFLIG
jgi:hypothetical protein